MSSKSSRARHRLEPLSLKEAMAGPGLSGLGDVLRAMVEPVRPACGAQHGSGAKIVSPGDSMSPDDMMSPGDQTSPGLALVATREPKAASPKSATGEHRPDEMKADRSQESRQLNSIIRPWAMAQHGMTTTEYTVYLCLYRAGIEGSDLNFRLCSVSMGRLGKQTGLPDRTCQRAVQSLKAKRVVEVVQPAQCEAAKPPVYRVKSYAAVMETWKELGFTHVGGGRSRILVDPRHPARHLGGRFSLEQAGPTSFHSQTQGERGIVQLTPGDRLSPGDDLSPDDMRSPGDDVSPPPGDIMPGGPGDNLSPHIGNKDRNKYRNTQATATSAVDVAAVAAVMCEFAAADREAAARVVESALAVCPDCTTEDVATAVRRKATQLQKQTGVKSPVAVLMKSCADLALDARNERVATEAKQAEQAARIERARNEAAFLSSLDGLPSDNPWRQILDSVKSHIPPQSFETWLRPTRFAGIRDRALQVCVPSSEFKGISEKYAELFSQAIRGLGLDLTGVECLTSDEFVRQREESANDR